MSATPEQTELDRLRLEVAELRARADIGDLFAHYGFYADCGAVAEWLDLFCDDAYMDVPNYSGDADSETLRISGREELRMHIVENPAVQAMRGRAQHHLWGPHTLSLRHDTAQVDSYGFVLVPSQSPGVSGPVPLTPSASFNRWSLRRVHGTWKIASCTRRRVEQSLPLLREIAEQASGSAGRVAGPSSARRG